MRFVLDTSSTKALSRKTTCVSPDGERSLCQDAIPWARGSTSSRPIFGDRQTIRVPAPTLRTTLPAIDFCSMGTVSSRPSFRRISKRTSCSVRSGLTCSIDLRSV